ncbi:hypothetical protein Fmac_019235 [Flemingia macrophylla]|uniref:Uncharacterized protein n=1 Tax=Flemingia macrophylla TaxID=520843 RepID=A0ABD1M792_9FABA
MVDCRIRVKLTCSSFAVDDGAKAHAWLLEDDRTILISEQEKQDSYRKKRPMFHVTFHHRIQIELDSWPAMPDEVMECSKKHEWAEDSKSVTVPSATA